MLQLEDYGDVIRGLFVVRNCIGSGENIVFNKNEALQEPPIRAMDEVTKRCQMLLEEEMKDGGGEAGATPTTSTNKRRRLESSRSKKNQYMAFGALPEWVTTCLLRPLTDKIEAATLASTDAAAASAWEDLLAEHFDRAPPWDQMIVNRYGVGEGIKPHVDLVQPFGPVVLGFNVLGEGVLRFNEIIDDEVDDGAVVGDKDTRLVGRRSSVAVRPGEEQTLVERGRIGANILEIRLAPGDVYILSGDARYKVAHAILPVADRERISVTVRRRRTST